MTTSKEDDVAETTYIAIGDGLIEVEIAALASDVLRQLIVEAGSAGDAEAVRLYQAELDRR